MHGMRQLAVRIALVGALFATAAVGQAGDVGAEAVLGRWLTAPSDEGQAQIEIARDGERYHGTIVWLEEPRYPLDDSRGMGGQPKIDRNNPDPALRQRPTLGLRIVEGFHYAGDGRWEGGTIYDPESGKTYKCKMRLTEEGDLYVRGYIGISLLGRTTTWSRVAGEGAGTP